MVAGRASTYKAVSAYVCFRWFFVMLMLRAFAIQSWNVCCSTGTVATERGHAAAANRADTHMSAERSSLARPMQEIQTVELVTEVATPGINPNAQTSIRVVVGLRTLNFHREESRETVNQSPSASSERPFEGLLDLDGSISSIKLMMESDPFEEFHVSNKSRWQMDDYRKTRAGAKKNAGGPGRWERQQHNHKRGDVYHIHYPTCSETLTDWIPCSNSTGQLFGPCPNSNQAEQRCAISAPAFYARQFKWPASRNKVRGPNVPNVPFLKKHEMLQELWRPGGRGSTISFGDDDARFPNGTNRYVDDLASMIPEVSFGAETRVALDIDCGVGNVAVALERKGVLTLSIAGESSADNGVQLVVERGYPALVQALLTHRLPYPSQAFDLIHCAACDVQWESGDGLKLMEANRILRAGGFFVWMDSSTVGATWNAMEELTKRICWTAVAKRGQIAVWQKPTNLTCYSVHSQSRPRSTSCNSSNAHGSGSWKVPLQSCLESFPETDGAVTDPWPARLQKPPRRLKVVPAAGIEAAKPEAYEADLNYWIDMVNYYVEDFGPVRVREVRNVLDMNAAYGGFAAAISLKSPPLQWWVLNVVPVDQPDRLAIIFDRGLLGVYHDWCESLDVYPRTFDLVHSVGLFSSPLRCGMGDVVREIDRVLRPWGFVIIRDQKDVLMQVQVMARALHWTTTVEDTESGPLGKDKFLSCQKTFWRPKPFKNGKSSRIVH